MGKMIEYRVTFGVQYAREPHPRWSEAHPSGWLTILAPSRERAREIAHAFLGISWAGLSAVEDYDWAAFYPRGELARIVDRP